MRTGSAVVDAQHDAPATGVREEHDRIHQHLDKARLGVPRCATAGHGVRITFEIECLGFERGCRCAIEHQLQGIAEVLKFQPSFYHDCARLAYRNSEKLRLDRWSTPNTSRASPDGAGAVPQRAREHAQRSATWPLTVDRRARSHGGRL